jgi:hypothetical protein
LRRRDRDQDEGEQEHDPPDQAAEVVADGGEDGVVGVTVAAGEIVAIHAVLALEMADDGLDGGTASHLAFDVGCDAALLLGRVDFELEFGRGGSRAAPDRPPLTIC